MSKSGMDELYKILQARLASDYHKLEENALRQICRSLSWAENEWEILRDSLFYALMQGMASMPPAYTSVKSELSKLKDKAQLLYDLLTEFDDNKKIGMRGESSDDGKGWAYSKLICGADKKMEKAWENRDTEPFDPQYTPETVSLSKGERSEKLTFWHGGKRVSHFMKELEWLLSAIDSALYCADTEMEKGKGRKADTPTRELVIALANAYYHLTGEPPDIGYSGSVGITKGKFTDFVSQILSLLDRNRAERTIAEDIAFAEKRHNENSYFHPQSYEVRPHWLAHPNGTVIKP